MRYVLVEAPEGASPRQQALRWTYICEGRVNVGDVVCGDFGGATEYMTVVETATKRAKLSSSYEGGVKTCRPATVAELNALGTYNRCLATYVRAENKLTELWERVLEARAAA